MVSHDQVMSVIDLLFDSLASTYVLPGLSLLKLIYIIVAAWAAGHVLNLVFSFFGFGDD